MKVIVPEHILVEYIKSGSKKTRLISKIGHLYKVHIFVLSSGNIKIVTLLGEYSHQVFKRILYGYHLKVKKKREGSLKSQKTFRYVECERPQMENTFFFL